MIDAQVATIVGVIETELKRQSEGAGCIMNKRIGALMEA